MPAIFTHFAPGNNHLTVHIMLDDANAIEALQFVYLLKAKFSADLSVDEEDSHNADGERQRGFTLNFVDLASAQAAKQHCDEHLDDDRVAEDYRSTLGAADPSAWELAKMMKSARIVPGDAALRRE